MESQELSNWHYFSGENSIEKHSSSNICFYCGESDHICTTGPNNVNIFLVKNLLNHPQQPDFQNFQRKDFISAFFLVPREGEEKGGRGESIKIDFVKQITFVSILFMKNTQPQLWVCTTIITQIICTDRIVC